MVLIDSVKFGEITVKGKTYYSDALVRWDGRVVLRQKKHIIDMDDFIDMAKAKPEAIVIGTGIHDVVRVSGKFRQEANYRGIRLYTDPSAKAVEMFNGLVAQGRKAVALIHTTC
jgi:hypothetical protein